MSGRTEIPDENYQAIYLQQLKWFVDRGYSLDDARRLTREMMETTFVSHSSQIQCESQKDYYEYIDEMSLGGSIYR